MLERRKEKCRAGSVALNCSTDLFLDGHPIFCGMIAFCIDSCMDHAKAIWRDAIRFLNLTPDLCRVDDKEFRSARSVELPLQVKLEQVSRAPPLPRRQQPRVNLDGIHRWPDASRAWSCGRNRWSRLRATARRFVTRHARTSIAEVAQNRAAEKPGAQSRSSLDSISLATSPVTRCNSCPCARRRAVNSSR